MEDNNPRCYRNGYEHGHWTTLTHLVPATTSKAMVLLQAHSDSPVNSNIYFDNVRIQVGDKTVTACELDGEVKAESKLNLHPFLNRAGFFVAGAAPMHRSHCCILR